MIGDGAALVQPVYTEDVVTAIAQALEHPGRATRRAFNIGGPGAMTWRAMMEEIALAVRGTHPLFIPVPRGAALAAASVLPRRIVSREQILRISEDKSVDIAEARAALGFAPVPFRDAIRLKESGKAEVEALYSR